MLCFDVQLPESRSGAKVLTCGIVVSERLASYFSVLLRLLEQITLYSSPGDKPEWGTPTADPSWVTYHWWCGILSSFASSSLRVVPRAFIHAKTFEHVHKCSSQLWTMWVKCDRTNGRRLIFVSPHELHVSSIPVHVRTAKMTDHYRTTTDCRGETESQP